MCVTHVSLEMRWQVHGELHLAKKRVFKWGVWIQHIAVKLSLTLKEDFYNTFFLADRQILPVRYLTDSLLGLFSLCMLLFGSNCLPVKDTSSDLSSTFWVLCLEKDMNSHSATSGYSNPWCSVSQMYRFYFSNRQGVNLRKKGVALGRRWLAVRTR